jgi:hypothetical protein
MKALERWIGPPMAAPETAAMRALRFLVVASTGASALGIAGIDFIIEACGRAATGAALLVMISVTALSAAVFFYRKIRLDDRWLMERCFALDEADE